MVIDCIPLGFIAHMCCHCIRAPQSDRRSIAIFGLLGSSGCSLGRTGLCASCMPSIRG
jgi:hypothetical protein